MKFIEAQIIDIIVHNWFPINPTFQVSKSKNEDEDDDIDVKRKGLKMSFQAKPIDLDSHPKHN